jgi:hypothetical protein
MRAGACTVAGVAPRPCVPHPRAVVIYIYFTRIIVYLLKNTVEYR